MTKCTTFLRKIHHRVYFSQGSFIPRPETRLDEPGLFKLRIFLHIPRPEIVNPQFGGPERPNIGNSSRRNKRAPNHPALGSQQPPEDIV